MHSDHGFAGTGRVILRLSQTFNSLKTVLAKANSAHGKRSTLRDIDMKGKARVIEWHDANANKATVAERIHPGADAEDSLSSERINANISKFHVVDLPQNIIISHEVELLSMSPTGIWMIVCFKKANRCCLFGLRHSSEVCLYLTLPQLFYKQMTRCR